MTVEKSWKNPYGPRLSEFPGRIFRNECLEADIPEIRRIAGSAETCMLELGSGSGQHTIALGKRNPNSAVFGFEVRFKRAFRTIEKAQAQNISNVYVIRSPAERLTEVFLKRSVAGVFVNFPDPWEKKRQRKHRILGVRLLDQLKEILHPDGVLSVKTDHKEYYQSFKEVLCSYEGYRVLEESANLHKSPFAVDNIVTEFEQLFMSQGLPCHYIKAVRC